MLSQPRNAMKYIMLMNLTNWPVTRTRCKSRVVVTATNTNDQWVINVSKDDIDEATALKEVSVGTSQVMNYLTQQAGGYHNVGFTHKDLYNALQRGKAKEIVDGDVNKLIAYFDYKKHEDPRWTTEAFDIQWHSVVSEFNVEKHPWVIEKGNTRYLWAQAYLTGHFFANIRSTQRCESMNALLAIALKHKKTCLDVVHAIEDGISRMHELQRETLYRIQEEIQSLSDECQHYILTKKFETVGLPCRHQLHILKHLDYTYLSETLIQNRWTKDAKASAPSFVDLNVPPEVMQMARFTTLRSTSSRFCYIASKTDASFKTARDEMKRLTEEFEKSFGLNDLVNQSSVVNNVCDP
ncbi:hypothetical protein F3Y22_tig00110895pilonHSYRG00834 [Hibiscus syriacus]|uniref:Uncharacterized protein n=1 Tax=Hibiscus syriacus TaxID=106335 RepID=A0A6A2ZG63_HIBSY|nr:hypothetical protein F3Y22_tig00110895pilonHSYRG00834 [Hibiscus syriacus]